MPQRRTLSVSESEKAALEKVVRSGEKAYQRERAAALLKIAEGHSAHWVARHGLLVVRDPDTVYSWLDQYEKERQAQWTVGKGRGRKLAFSPCAPDGSISESGAAPCGGAHTNGV